MEEVLEGLELIKTHGFQPKQYEELLQKSRSLSQSLPGADLAAKARLDTEVTQKDKSLIEGKVADDPSQKAKKVDKQT